MYYNTYHAKQECLGRILSNPYACGSIPMEFMKDENFLLEIIGKSRIHTEYIFKYISKDLKDNETFMLKAAQKNGFTIENASEKVKNNDTIGLAAFNKNPEVFKFLSERLRDDENLLLKAMKEDTRSFSFASERLRDNKEVTLKCIKYDAYLLKYASNRLKNDIEIVTEAISRIPFSYGNASEKLRGEKKLALIAYKKVQESSNPRKPEQLEEIFSYLSPKLRKEIGNNDPIQYLERFLSIEKMKNELDNELSIQQEANKKLKI
jgi:hypothetical protein